MNYDQILQLSNIIIILMNFFSNDLIKNVANIMSNNAGWNVGSQKQIALRSNLERCTYPDETKYMIEKAVKQLFHVYPFLTPDILMFNENGIPRRYIELKGILEIDIKGKTCKIDFNMMLPNDYPRSPPNIRIVNRNPDYVVDPFYQSLKSKTDPSSYVLNQKLMSIKNWHPSSSLVNIVLQCNDTFKSRFPFSKPVENNFGGSNNAWDSLYNKKQANNTNNNFNGGGFNNQPANNWGTNNNNGWGGNNNNAWTANNNQGWTANNNNNTWNNTNTNAWNTNNNNNAWTGQPNNWGTTNNANWGNNSVNNNWSNNNNNTWGTTNNNNWGGQQIGGMGGMGGIMGGTNVNSSIASAQKLVAKQKQSLTQMNTQYLKLIQKNQFLDITKQSLASQQQYLRKQNYEMSNFLKQNQSTSQIISIVSIVQPKDALSQQILDLISGIKARQQCAILLQNKFAHQEISLEDFMKNLRKIQEAKFEDKYLLLKCIKNSS